MPYTTHQRMALAGAIMSAERPLTAVELWRQAQKDIPQLGMATVYRALKRLVAEGQIRPVEVPGIKVHYESMAHRHHHFFFCQQCRRLFNLPGCVRGIVSLAPRGFAVRRHEIVLYGECAACRAAPDRGPPARDRLFSKVSGDDPTG